MRWHGAVVGIGLIATGFFPFARTQSAVPAAKPPARSAVDKAAPGAALFEPAPLRTLRLDLDRASLAALRKNEREYAPATFSDGQIVLTNVGVHLKGAAGSFRPLEDNPALTVNFPRFVKGQRWYGLRKIHLNNSVQDPTLLCENLCGELFRRAGVPAPRVTNARVLLNGRDLGVYVLIEGFDQVFLKQYYPNADGNLYDGGFCQDINAPLAKLSGNDAKNQPELDELVAAAEEPDPARRWARLAERLNIDRFISFCAVEVLTWDWDGYVLKPNNYKLYWDPASRRVDFFPHGMDQMFWETEATILPRWSGLVAQGVLSTPEGRRRYMARVGELLTNVFEVATMTNRINAYAAPIRTALAAQSGRSARDFENEVQQLNERVAARVASVTRQLRTLPQRELNFAQGAVRIVGWAPQVEDAATLAEETGPDDVKALGIRSSASTTASWRVQLLLPPGRFRFEGRARGEGITASKDEKGEGAGLRISGSEQPRTNKLGGTTGWQTLSYEFDAPGGGEVTLICELRARRGRVWFDLDSLRLTRLN